MSPSHRFHLLLGLLLTAAYLYLIVHLHTLLPQLSEASQGVRGVAHLPRAGRGFLVIFGLPLAAIVCFVCPRQLMWRFSPRVPPSYDYLFTEGAWYALGYGLLLIGVGVLLLFR